MDNDANLIALGLAVTPSLEDTARQLVWGSGPIPARLAIVGEAPGEEEEKQLKPFVGRSGQLLDEKLQKAGLIRSEIYVTNVMKARPVLAGGRVTRTPDSDEVVAWTPLLERELKAVQPEFVLLLGSSALKALWSRGALVTKLRGQRRKHSELGFTMFASFHPAAVLRRRELEPVFERDLIRLGQLVRGDLAVQREHHYYVVRTLEQLHKLRDKLLAAPSMAFDLETRSYSWQTEPILCVAFSPTLGEAYVVPLVGEGLRAVWKDDQLAEVKLVLCEIFASDVPKIAHNAKFDVQFLEHNGIRVNNLAHDTMVEHHLLDENAPHGLKFLVGSVLGENEDYDDELRAVVHNSSITFDAVPEAVLWPYAARDVDYTYTLHSEKFWPKIQASSKFESYYTQRAMPLVRALANVERRGVVIDQPWMTDVRALLEYDREKTLAELCIGAGFDINPSSVKQLRALFFDKRGHKSAKKTTTGQPSTDDSVMQALAVAGDELADKVLQYRTARKYISTFIDGVLEYVGPDKRVHPTYSATGTVTWRLSCRNPNLQNIPNDARLRGAFCAPPGYVFAAVDYKQIEFVILAALAGEQYILGVYNQGLDVHKFIAAKVLGCQPEELTDDVRFMFKSLVYGLNYGRQANSIAHLLGLTLEEAEELISLYFSAFPRIREWREQQIELAHRQGYVESVFGFRRRLNFRNVDDATKFGLERQAMNSPIQGTAAVVTNTAMVRLDELHTRHQTKAENCMTLHDALFFYLPETSWKDDVRQVQAIMETPIPELGLVPRVSIEVGTRWGDSLLLKQK